MFNVLDADRNHTLFFLSKKRACKLLIATHNCPKPTSKSRTSTQGLNLRMTSQYLFVTGSDSDSIVERLMKLKDDRAYTELYVSMIELDVAVSNALISVLRDRSRSWEGIYFAHCTGNVDVVISNALELGSVEKLSLLPSGHHIDDRCLFALANGLRLNTSIKSLVLRVDLFQELSEALAEGLSANSSLEELSLILSTAETTAVETLARGIQKNSGLKALKLNRCSLEDGQVAALIQALENHPSLRELIVQGSSCRAKGIVAISGLLQSDSKKPFKLDLSNQQFQRNGMFGISFLAPALPANKSMRFLDLSSNDLADVDVTCIASALCENSALEELKLTNCNISDNGVRIIAEHLPKMTGLKSLWLYGNPFGTQGANSLLDALRRNMYLEQLLLPRDKGKPFDDIQRKTEYFLALNKGGRRILLESNNVPMGLWPLIFERVNTVRLNSLSAKKAQANVIYFLLQGPAFMR
jgi:hypothetical protein